MVSCSSNEKSINEKVESATKPIEVIENEDLSIDPIAHLEKIVLNFDSSQRHSYPTVDSITKSIILKLRSIHQDTLDHFLTLFFLKKYRFHMECCHQGYELRTSSHNGVGIDSTVNPLLFEYLRMAKPYEPDFPIDSLLVSRFEFMNSGIIMKWIDSNPKYLLNQSIDSNYQVITRIQKQIQNEL